MVQFGELIMQKKSLIATTLFFSIIIVMCFNFTVYANNNGTCGDSITWILSDDGILTLSGTGDMYDYSANKANRPPWYTYCEDIYNVIISDGITSVGDAAFDNCSNLQNLHLGKDVASLGWRSFGNCTSLENITFPSTINYIDEMSFLGCVGLTNVYISDLYAWCNINFGAGHANPLSYAKNLYINEVIAREITIPNGIKKINNYIFYGLGCLEKVIIPDGVVSIGMEPFGNCENLKEVLVGKDVSDIEIYSFPNDVCLKIDERNNSFLFEDGVLFNKEKTKLIQYFDDGSRSEYYIPDSVSSVGKFAFQNCTDLFKIIINNNITTIGQAAFSYCMSLTDVVIGENVRFLSNQSFYNCQNLKEIIIPDNVSSIGIDAFLNCRSLESISFGTGITGISTQAFCQCVSLKKLIIPDSVTFIGNRAFETCVSLTEVTLGNKVKNVYDRAFYGCGNLENIEIHNTLTSIGEDAFYGCNKLSKVDFRGTNADWNSISIQSGNDCLLNSTLQCSDTVTLTVMDDETSFTVSLPDGVNNAKVIMALYKGNSFVNCYISDYIGQDIPFVISEDFDLAKIFVWKDFVSLQPICNVTYYYKTTYRFLELCNNSVDEWIGIFEALMSNLYKYYNYDIISNMPEEDILKLAEEMYFIQGRFQTTEQFDAVLKEAYNNLYVVPVPGHSGGVAGGTVGGGGTSNTVESAGTIRT